MVFVGMGEEDAANLVAVFDQVGKIGDDDVNARHFIIGKAQANVNYNDVVVLANCGAVLANLADAAERDHLHGVTQALKVPA